MKQSGVITPTPLAWQKRAAAWLVIGLLRLTIGTWRRVWIDSAAYPETRGPVIFCVWHNRLPLALGAYDHTVRARWPSAGIGAMISASRDGSFLSAVAESFGITPIRGSSSRRGPQALLEAKTLMEKNYSIVITPDGPRGPKYQIHDGIILLAQLTGRPIIPTSNYVSAKIQLRSWDRFQIPLPFARCELRYAAPLWIPRDLTDSQREELRLQLQNAMLQITRD
ncbi:MAG TPA: lysophospholipid acyltransferase family protein [Verrucomicrobiae bacterium]|jgi:hypothetical protein|nr:lysophospholipid acyltransferase family protein [Verrucomicrobiae bacterium]